MTFELFIPGVPAPQGSKELARSGSKTWMRETNERTKPWRKVLVRALQDERGRPRARFESAVWVELRFVFARPKSHRPDSLPTSKALGDVDKLTRAVLDGLTQAGIIADDSNVLSLRNVEKVYGPNPGVHVRIGSAVPNPFGGLSLGMVFVDEIATVEWQPSAADLAQEQLREALRDEGP